MADERPYDQHSESCHDHNVLIYEEDAYIGECVCRPSEDAKPPDRYELWWCEWCAEPAVDGDPCQRCGTPATRRWYVAEDTLDRLTTEAQEQQTGGGDV